MRIVNGSRETAVADRVEVGAGLWAKFKGLMGRESLASDEGLWLPESNGIHMMFMRFPIDVVFVGRSERRDDGAGEIRPVVGVREALRPWTGIVWYVRGAHGVIELPVGTIAASGTRMGDLLHLLAE